MIQRNLLTGAIVTVLALFTATQVFAHDGPPADGDTAVDVAEEASAVTAENIDDWIKQLDADRFSQRQAASQKLLEAAGRAVPALTEAALGDSRETTSRCIEILKKHFQSGDEATKAAAGEALQKIAQSSKVTVARAAKEVLEPRPKNEPHPNPVFPGGGIQIGGGQFGGGQIQIQVQAGAQGIKRVSIKNVNGAKDIEVLDNDRQVKIHEDPAGAISMEVTEKKDGKEETKKYQANSADELKKNDPEAHKIYQQYSKHQLPAIQIQAGAMPFPPAPRRKPFNLNEAVARLDAAQKQLDRSAERIKQLAENSNQADELNKTLQQLEQIKQELEEAKANLGR
jgi:hypothetical protein